jgi:hypothetical protein
MNRRHSEYSCNYCPNARQLLVIGVIIQQSFEHWLLVGKIRGLTRWGRDKRDLSGPWAVRSAVLGSILPLTRLLFSVSPFSSGPIQLFTAPLCLRVDETYSARRE